MSKRYIEADRAIDALKAIRYGLWEIDIPSPTVPEYIEHHEQIKNMMEITDGWIKKLEEQSTADVVERKKGKWIEDGYWSEGVGMGESYGSYFRCFVCEERVRSGYKHCYMNFCPNCGSDNREETEDVGKI